MSGKMSVAMNVIRELVRDPVTGVVVGDTLDCLSSILEPDCAAVIWRRQPDRRFHAWISGLDPTAMPRIRTILPSGKVKPEITDLFDARGLPASFERSLLIDDIRALAAHFNTLVSAPFLRLRLDVVTNNACRKFHTDSVLARLICTYRGTGTQYGIASDGPEPRRIFTVPTGAPVLLRGKLWPEHPCSDLVHRSPPIEGTGETRVVLVIDPVFDPDEDD